MNHALSSSTSLLHHRLPPKDEAQAPGEGADSMLSVVNTQLGVGDILAKAAECHFRTRQLAFISFCIL